MGPLDFSPPLAGLAVSGELNPWLLLLALVVTCLSAYNALRAAERIRQRRWQQRWLWQGAGTISLGGGIWAGLFICLLAYQAPTALEFQAVPSLLALVLSLLTALVAMLYIGSGSRHGRALPAVSLLVGFGFMTVQTRAILAVESVGTRTVQFDLWLVSILLAVLVAYVVLRSMLYLQRHRDRIGPGPIVLAALAVGVTAIGMDLTAVRSLRLTLVGIADVAAAPARPGMQLALEVALVVGALAGVILLGTYVGRRNDRRLQAIVKRLGRSEGVDAVTGLPLEAMVREQMNLLACRITRPATIALFLVDCERAQRAGMLLGEDARAEAMCLIAQRLGSMKGSERDLLAVSESGRFVVIAPIVLAEQAQVRADFIAELCRAPLELRGRALRLPIRIGYSVWPADGDDYAGLLASAELALHESRGGNPGSIGYTPEMRTLSERRLEIENALGAALDDQALELAYQPIVHAGNGRLAGLEALARWRHPTLGQVPPDEFIAVAEEVGLSADIDRYVLRRAIADLASLPPEVRKPLRMAVNCAASTLDQPRLQDEIEAILGAHGISPRRLTLEITEVAWAKGDDAILERLERIAQTGVGLAIDDFGTGHSSLARLRRLPADALKIDREFVASLGTPRGDELVRSIIELGLRLAIKVVAEGVETAEQEAFLRAAGCHFFQGYRYGRPVPWEQLSLVAGLRVPVPAG